MQFNKIARKIMLWMKDNWGKAITVIIILFGVILLFRQLLTLEKTRAAALITASTTIIISVISLVFAKYQEKKLAIDKELREKKIPIYEKLIEFIFSILWSDKLNKRAPTDAEMQKFFITFTQQIMLWGSDEVIVQWGKFRQQMIDYSNVQNQNKSTLGTTMFCLEDLLFVIRKDIGYKNIGIKQGEVLRLFINDVDNYLK